MGKYLRLLRLGDQYFQVGAVAAAGWLVGGGNEVVWWMVATILLSCPTFIINELADRQDVDKFSWNGIHVREKVSSLATGGLFVVLSAGGLALAYGIGKWGWGLAMWVLAVLYSMPPVRLKARAVVDILVQETVWWAIPFLAIVWGKFDGLLVSGMVVFGGCVMWCGFFPYQLADILADTKARLRPTHVVWGMKRSLYFGAGTGLAALGLFWALRIDRLAWWSWAFVGLTVFVLANYGLWLKMRRVESQVKSMQNYVKFTKPLTQVMVLGLVFLYLWQKVNLGRQ